MGLLSKTRLAVLDEMLGTRFDILCVQTEPSRPSLCDTEVRLLLGTVLYLTCATSKCRSPPPGSPPETLYSVGPGKQPMIKGWETDGHAM